MTQREQELSEEVEQLRQRVNKLSLFVVGLIEQYSPDGRAAIIKTKGGVMEFSPRPPRILDESDAQGNWHVSLDYGT